MRTLAHIVNPFRAAESSDLFYAQPITFASMVHARDVAAGRVNVELLAVQYSDDTVPLPPGFRSTSCLSRSVLDLHHFEQAIRLPLIEDILAKMYEESSAEYLIYTNVDIGLFPDFYLQVNAFIDQGYDAFIINRRRLKGVYTRVSQLPEIYKERGKSHPGFDCFVFHRSLYPKLLLDGICIGVPFIEIAFSQNLMARSHCFKLFDQEFLTFHIGEEIYKRRAPREYYRYNQKQFWKLVPALFPEMQLTHIPYYSKIMPLRLLRWALHPCIPIRLILRLEWRRIRQWFGAS